jgi:small subunit ribosomal protein S6
MRKYEVMIIVNPKLKEDDAKKVVDKELETITKEAGKVIKNDWWGIKDLAYEIEKHNSGYYAVAEFESSTETMEELYRLLKLDLDVIRAKILKIED